MMFAYMIGMILFAVLYFIGMKICEFFDSYPQLPPPEKNYIVPPVVCNLTINGKDFCCIKEEKVNESYNYNAECDIIEYKMSFKKYTLSKPIEIDDMIDKISYMCEIKENNNLIKCYATDDRRTLIPLEAETEEKIYTYRKPEILRKFSVKRKPTTLR